MRGEDVARSLRLPDFVIIGAAKAGTTSLYHYLSQHPSIFMSTPKEPEFFARDEIYARGLNHYAALFSEARPDQLCGEASTLYTLSPHFPDAPARLARAVPKAKLIYIMREPVSRAYSYYVQIVKNYQSYYKDYVVHRTFEECINDDTVREHPNNFYAPFDYHLPDASGLFLDGSDYPRQINSYLNFFPKEQILFMIFEELIARPAASIERIISFLGVDNKLDAYKEKFSTSNVSRQHFETVARSTFGAALTGRFPSLARLTRPLPQNLRRRLRDTAFDMLKVAAPEPPSPPPMTPATRRHLEKRFLDQRAETIALTGLDLDRWWDPALAMTSEAASL